MLERPVFKELYRIEVVRGEGVLLLSDRGDHVLCGRVYEHLAPWLTGGYSSDDIVARLAARHGAAALYYALAELEERGYLGLPGHGGGRAAGLARPGLLVREAAGITVALTDDYLRPELEDLNRRALRTRRPWLLAKPWGSVTWVGPLFLPGETCCWKCLEQRLRGNQPVRSYWWSTARSGAAVRPGHGPTGPGSEAYRFRPTDFARWIAGGSHAHLAGLLITRAVGEARWHRHPVARRPQCPACGDARLYARQVVRPLRLARCLKRFTTDGGHRCVLPRETMRTLAPLIDPLTGIVQQVRPLADGTGAGSTSAGQIHAFVADHAGAASWHNLLQLRRSLPTRSGGKGRTAVQARTSAVAEAVERYCGTWQGDEPRVRRSFIQLGTRAIDPNRCMLFSDTQYRRRRDWNRRCSLPNRIPVRFDPTRPIDWTPVWSLTERRHKYLPSMQLYFGYPLDPDRAFCWADSNGCAAGNTCEEAILQGFLELVERDSVAIWWYNRVPRPAVDLTGNYCESLRSSYASLERVFWVLDITSDLGIPCFVAVSRQRAPLPGKTLLGFGAHLDARVAVMRALTEMNQMLALARSVEPDARRFAPALDAWFGAARIEAHPYLVPGVGRATRLTDFPRAARRDLRDDVRWCQRVVEQRGMELLVLDQTRPDIDAAVVRVIVPGLRHFRARYAPGRLYDTPVALGWLAKPRTEAELNSLELFM
jgi:bacteriocin biosynthesis cyclodehydratase domain-containing protein